MVTQEAPPQLPLPKTILFISDCVTGRKNNYDILRFLAATLVILSHAYPLSGSQGELFILLSNNQATLGHLGVGIFFIISGFLVTQSYDRWHSPFIFLKARILRIFPGLLAVLLAIVFVLGPLVTTLSLSAYFRDGGTYGYLRDIFLFPIYYNLPGVFVHNAYPNAVNGSLWTLAYEFAFYLVLVAAGIFTLLRRRWASLIILTAICILVTPIAHFVLLLPAEKHEFYTAILSPLPPLVYAFAIGVLAYLWRDHIRLRGRYAAIAAVLLLASLLYGGFVYLFPVCGAYLIFYVAYHPRIPLNRFGKYGDVSYGLYIYAFPVQQLVTMLHGGRMAAWQNALFAFPITVVLAFLSWHLIEKPCLRLKTTRKNATG